MNCLYMDGMTSTMYCLYMEGDDNYYVLFIYGGMTSYLNCLDMEGMTSTMHCLYIWMG